MSDSEINVLKAATYLGLSERAKAIQVLVFCTLAFTVCFACWMLNGVLVTYLVENGIFRWDEAQIGWLLAIPVLSGSLARLPVGILTDKYGGRVVYTVVMLISAVAMYLLSFARNFWEFFFCSLGFGLAGAAFAVGIAYTSIWFKREQQGTALGIFGIGNAGASVTTLGAPALLIWLTVGGEQLERWRVLPQLYAAALVFMAIAFYLLTFTRAVEQTEHMNLQKRLAPLASPRVWRFGYYYFFVFGGFVALAQWLVPYYVNVYSMSIVMAGLMATIFSLPSGVIRALGGWLSDRFGARQIMLWVFGCSLLCCLLLLVPRMDIYSPGGGVVAARSGIVTEVTPEHVVIGEKIYQLMPKTAGEQQRIGTETMEARFLVWPTFESWQDPVVRAGDQVKKRQLLAKGVTHVYFQANVWIFTFLVFILGIVMGIGKAGVYKYIPDYFPKEVGVVGGMVGVIGGLGGFFCPVIFGYFLKSTGIWTSCWIFFTILVLTCLWWFQHTVKKLMNRQVPVLMKRMELDDVTN
ncbi:MAG: NarK/NasA family nitrate transporter [Cyanobacteria bacterium NC_groundwater_1444_Ag_S-0.65um_54_12]|nr:NarK/NasA family nitrate transporter [Cyanobacteria bacterium NC_groundwater_1444_Ag_S-0.65um_54_12]